ncbi:MAG: hypothetical protein KY455_04130 [Euryarchaeota archaeon]|nr:hypothetical protein [Euryarchaeota archaeon]
MAGRPAAPPLLFLFALILVSVSLAGCGGDDEEVVLRDGPIGDDDETFSVPKGTERLKIVFSTRPETVDCAKDPFACTAGMQDWGQDPPEGKVRFGALNIGALQRGDLDGMVESTLTYNKEATHTLSDPPSGTWLIEADMEEDGQSYDGPATAKVTTTGAPGAGFVFGNAIFDILGLVVAIAGFVGAYLIYRRRSRFMSTQLHRIDDTFERFGDDLNECRTNLIELKKELNQMLMRRKIEEPQYLILEKRIEQYLHDINTPGNRHFPVSRAPEPETVSVLESEEDVFPADPALEHLRRGRMTDD